LRSDLRTFAPVLDTEWSEPLRDELSWLADELGAVRDADVLLARLQQHVLTLPKDDQPDAEPLLDRLAGRRAEAQARLLTALASPRYAELLERLVDAARAPRLDGDAGRDAAEEVVAGLVRRPWRKLRRAVADLGDAPSDEALHGVRIRAKRARYAADVAVPVVGEPARSFAKAMAGVQEVLGEHHDAIVAEQWLRDAATDARTGATAVATGQLIAMQRAEADARRRAWPEAWRGASRKRHRKWMA
jgi:CHAD domain-containing protein